MEEVEVVVLMLDTYMTGVKKDSGETEGGGREVEGTTEGVRATATYRAE